MQVLGRLLPVEGMTVSGAVDGRGCDIIVADAVTGSLVSISPGRPPKTIARVPAIPGGIQLANDDVDHRILWGGPHTMLRLDLTSGTVSSVRTLRLPWGDSVVGPMVRVHRQLAMAAFADARWPRQLHSTPDKRLGRVFIYSPEDTRAARTALGAMVVSGGRYEAWLNAVGILGVSGDTLLHLTFADGVLRRYTPFAGQQNRWREESIQLDILFPIQHSTVRRTDVNGQSFFGFSKSYQISAGAFGRQGILLAVRETGPPVGRMRPPQQLAFFSSRGELLRRLRSPFRGRIIWVAADDKGRIFVKGAVNARGDKTAIVVLQSPFEPQTCQPFGDVVLGSSDEPE